MRVHHRVTSSTNDRARELAERGAPHFTVVTASSQTAGRGRQGRSWLAEPGCALLMSVVLRSFDELLPLRAGLAVSDLAPGSMVKWPNDVLVAGRKLAGILVEGRPQSAWAVCGIGVNVSASPADVDAAHLGREDIEEVLGELLVALRARVAEPESSVISVLRERDALLDERVVWAAGSGVGAGIGDDGSLRVALDDGSVTSLRAGEVHLTHRD